MKAPGPEQRRLKTRTDLEREWHTHYGGTTAYNHIDTLIFTAGKEKWESWCKLICEEMEGITMEFDGRQVNPDLDIEQVEARLGCSRPVAYTIIRSCIFSRIASYRYPGDHFIG